MKKILIIAMALAGLVSCGRTVTTAKHEADKRSFDAWVQVQKELHPEYLWQQTELGSWILEEETGKGDLITGSEDTVYVYANHTIRNSSGTILSTSTARVAQQVGTYNEANYYGPNVWYMDGIYAGIDELLTGMRDGGRRVAAVPGWLLTYKRYDAPEKYLNDSTSNSPAIYEVQLIEHFRRPVDWELDSIGRYLARKYPAAFGNTPAAARADSSGAFGFWYTSLKAPSDKKELKDTTVYINYTGRLLNGKVFDTTIRDTAITHGLYSSGHTYSPVAIKYGTSWSDIKMGSSETSVKEGFARILSKMKAHEKGVGIFYSKLGYDVKGSGSRIPGYSPLCFEVELVNKPE